MIVGSFRPDRQFLGGEQVPSRVAVSSRMLVSGNRVYHVGSIWSRWIMSLRPWKLRCSVSLKANPFNKYFPKPKKRTNCYGEIPMENTMLLVTSLMYHEKKNLQWGPPAGFGPIPSTWLALMLRQDFRQAHVVAHLGLHLETQMEIPEANAGLLGKTLLNGWCSIATFHYRRVDIRHVPLLWLFM